MSLTRAEKLAQKYGWNQDVPPGFDKELWMQAKQMYALDRLINRKSEPSVTLIELYQELVKRSFDE